MQTCEVPFDDAHLKQHVAICEGIQRTGNNYCVGCLACISYSDRHYDQLKNSHTHYKALNVTFCPENNHRYIRYCSDCATKLCNKVVSKSVTCDGEIQEITKYQCIVCKMNYSSKSK